MPRHWSPCSIGMAVIEGNARDPMTHRPRRLTSILAAVLLLGGTACVRAPNVVYLVDGKTAIERQASGEMRALENDLRQSGLSPRAEPFTRGELGDTPGQGEDPEGLAQVYGEVLTDADRLDALLVRRCVGEALDGLLEETPATCAGAIDAAEVTRLVQRANRNRRQLWTWLLKKTPGSSETTIRESWRRHHLEGLICGAQVQQPDRSWGSKRC